MSASYYFKQSFMFCFSLVRFNHYCVFSHLLLSEEVKNGAFLQASLDTNPQDPAVCVTENFPGYHWSLKYIIFLSPRNTRSIYAPLDLLGQCAVRMGISVYLDGSSHVDYHDFYMENLYIYQEQFSSSSNFTSAQTKIVQM